MAAKPASAAPNNDLSTTVVINGRSLADVDTNNPLLLGTSDLARVEVSFSNDGPTEMTIRGVRLEGRVMGMAFFSYTTRLDVVLPPGAVAERKFDFDVEDLTRQANGLIPAYFDVLGPERNILGHDTLVVDVKGSMVSSYGVFGLLIAGITVVLIASLLMAIWRRTLPLNRWQRAVRFLPAGLGIGLVLTFTLSAARLLAPGANWWVPLLVISSGGAFLLGYLLPFVGPADPGMKQLRKASRMNGAIRRPSTRSVATNAADPSPTSARHGSEH